MILLQSAAAVHTFLIKELRINLNFPPPGPSVRDVSRGAQIPSERYEWPGTSATEVNKSPD